MKKIFLLLLALTSVASADYVFYADNAASVVGMGAILDSLAMIFKHDNYIDLLRLIVMFGTFVALVSTVAESFSSNGSGGLIKFGKYHLFVVAVLSIAFSAKTTVWVKTNNIPTYLNSSSSSTTGLAVDNIPTIVAYGFEFVDKFGKDLTDIFQTAFMTYGDYDIRYNGFGGHFKDVTEILGTNFSQSDASLGSELQSFFSNCVYIPYSAHGQDGLGYIEQIRKSENIVSEIDSLYSSSASLDGIKLSDFTTDSFGEIYTCSNYWDMLKTSKINGYALSVSDLLKDMNQGDMNLLKGVQGIPVNDMQQMVIQAGMINALSDAKDLSTGIPGAAYTSGKSQAEYNIKNMSTGLFFAQSLPHLQQMLKMFLLAIFPLVIAFALLPGGLKVLKGYATIALTIQMWGALEAPLNFFITKYTENIIPHTVDYYSSVRILSDVATNAGIAGYLMTMVPVLAFAMVSGSFTALSSIGSTMTSNFAKNFDTAANAADAKLVAQQQTMSKEVGKDLSIGEMQHSQGINQGKFDAYEQSSYMKQGDSAVREKKLLDVNQGIENLKSQKSAIGGSWQDVMTVGANSSSIDISKQKGYNSTVNNNQAFLGGVSDGVGTSVNANQVETLGKDSLFDSKNFQALDGNLTGLVKNQTFSENGGVENTIVANAAIDAKTQSTSLASKMSQSGNSTDTVGTVQGTNEGLTYANNAGFVSGTTTDQNFSAGKHKAADTNSQAAIIDKFGQAKIEKSNFHAENKSTIQNLTSDEFYNNQPGGQDNYIGQKQKFDLTGADAQFKGVDSNGNSQVSDKEIGTFGTVQTKQSQADFINLRHEQNEKEQAAIKMQQSLDPRLRSGATSGSEFGSNSGSSLANYNNAMTNANTTIDPYNKDIDLTTKRNLDSENVTKKDLAEIKTVDTMEKNAFTKGRGEHEGQAFLEEKDRAYNETYQKNLDKAHEQGLNGTAAVNWASKQTASDIKMKDSANGQRMYGSEIALQKQQIADKKAAIVGKDGSINDYSQKQQALSAYKQRANSFAPGSAQRKVLDQQIHKLESDMNNIRSHSANKADFDSKVGQLNNLNHQEKNVEHNVATKMQNEGRLSINKDGSLHFHDSKDDFANDPHLSRHTAEIKGDQDSHKVVTIGLDGKEVEKTTDSTNKTVTDSRSAKKGNVEEGDFRTDITYNLKDKTGVSDEVLQYGTTGLNTAENVANFVPLGKLTKLK